MDGILVIDKPAGPTSFDVVRRVRVLTKEKKAGHLGTLDPLATGVLPICLGEATKVVPFYADADKEYEALVRLGVETDTYDVTGKVLATAPVDAVNLRELEAKVASFRGEYWQTPPMFSAVKVDGKRLYELARKGEEVERKPRKVTIHEIELSRFDAAKGELSLRVKCSKGTYVRSIAHELGRELGTGGALAALRRTGAGPFRIEQAVPLPVLMDLAASGQRAELERFLIPLRSALPELREVVLDEARARKVGFGMVLGGRDLAECGAPRLEPDEKVRIVGPDGRLLAIAEQRPGGLRYLRVMVGPAATP